MGGVEDYVERLKAGQVDRRPGVLPPHYPTCFGCGPEAQAGLHLEVQLVDDEVVAEYVFGDLHSGAPGIAHGGTVAALVDDLLGYALYLVRGRAAEGLPSSGRDLAGAAQALGYPADTQGDFLDDYRRATRRARAVVERVFYA